MTQQALTNDSFLNLLEELRNQLDAISTENAVLALANDANDSIQESVMKCESIVDTLCADLVAQQDHKSAGFTHISKAMPVNTLNNDVLYIGINRQGFTCVFNHFTQNETIYTAKHFECHYIKGDEIKHQMTDLLWWKILTLPTNSDIFEEGELDRLFEKPLTTNPYALDSNEAKQWKQG